MAPTERVDGELCPRFHHAIELIGRRWTGAIISVLLAGPRRFSDIRAAIPGLSERLLIHRLRELDTQGLVTRRVLPGPPVGVEYELTEAGRDLQAAVVAVSDWANRWLPQRDTYASLEDCEAV